MQKIYINKSVYVYYIKISYFKNEKKISKRIYIAYVFAPKFGATNWYILSLLCKKDVKNEKMRKIFFCGGGI